jgi:glycosyltransferase involved in cell wall biosynthesis
MEGHGRQRSVKLPWMLKWERFMKRVIVRNAAKVITVSEGERKELREEFPDLKADHFAFITNGYDPMDFLHVRTLQKTYRKLTLSHVGTIYGGIAGEFLAALQRLVREQPGIGEKLEVRLVGDIAHEYLETVRKLEAAGVLRVYGLRPHGECLQIVSESDVLLILLGGKKFLPSHIPAKVFEYLHAGKPILAIARDGELTEIVKQSGLGIVVSPESSEKLAQTMLDLCMDHAAGRLVKIPNQPYIRSFERAALTEKLAAILNEVKGGHYVRA